MKAGVDIPRTACRELDIALNRSAVGRRPADGEVAMARTYETLVEYSFLNVRFAPDSDHGADMPECLNVP